MRCPNCNRIQRLTDREKIAIKEKGVMEIPCYHCGTIIVYHKYDVDKNAKRKHNVDIGICTNCGMRPASPGLHTCDKCREYQTKYNNRTVKSTGYRELFVVKEPKKKKKELDLDDISKMAHDKGLSYGDMVAILEGRKKEKKDLD